MQTGFAMLCAGSIRAKNVKNVLLWNLLDSCGGGVAYWVCGFAFAYGGQDDGPKTFVGNTDFFLRNNDTPYEIWFFNFAFACAVSSASLLFDGVLLVWPVDGCTNTLILVAYADCSRNRCRALQDDCLPFLLPLSRRLCLPSGKWGLRH